MLSGLAGIVPGVPGKAENGAAPAGKGDDGKIAAKANG
jgi:hypothetical protein